MSGFVDIAISLIAVYIAFSLMVSWINEQIATALQWRGNNLKYGIEQMLGRDAASDLYLHPIITATQPNGKLPQYISSRQFCAALLSYVGTLPSVIASGKSIVSDAASVIAGIPKGNLQKALQSIYDEAGQDYTSFVRGIEQWYDDQMDRVSGWYHQHATRAIVIIAAIIVAALNVDTIHFVRQVACQSALRASIAQPISKAAGSGGLTQTQIAADIFANTSFGWNVSQEAQPCAAAGSGAQPLEDWKFWLLFWLLKILGLVLTVIALAQGAPFWFDLLKSVVNVRNAGNLPAPARSATSPP